MARKGFDNGPATRDREQDTPLKRGTVDINHCRGLVVNPGRPTADWSGTSSTYQGYNYNAVNMRFVYITCTIVLQLGKLE